MPLLVKSEIIHFVSLIYEIRCSKQNPEPFVEWVGVCPFEKSSSQSLSSFKFNCISKKEKASVSLLRQISKNRLSRFSKFRHQRHVYWSIPVLSDLAIINEILRPMSFSLRQDKVIVLGVWHFLGTSDSEV